MFPASDKVGADFTLDGPANRLWKGRGGETHQTGTHGSGGGPNLEKCSVELPSRIPNVTKAIIVACQISSL